jgi:hypothetical protein
MISKATVLCCRLERIARAQARSYNLQSAHKGHTVPQELLENLLKEELSTSAIAKRRSIFGTRVAVLQIHDLIVIFTVTGRCGVLCPCLVMLQSACHSPASLTIGQNVCMGKI